MTPDDLAAYCFDGAAHPLRALAAHWLTESRRFRAFVAANRDKIRKKVRSAGDDATRADVVLELAVAHRLAGDARCALTYEPLAATGRRGPDYALSFQQRPPVYVEVRRLRAAVTFGRLADVLCAKLGQLPPATGTLLVVGSGLETEAAFDLTASLERLATLAARHDDAFFVQRHLTGARDFTRRVQRLSAVLWWRGWDRPAALATLWVAPQPRFPFPADLCTALTAAFMAGG